MDADLVILPVPLFKIGTDLRQILFRALGKAGCQLQIKVPVPGCEAKSRRRVEAGLLQFIHGAALAFSTLFCVFRCSERV